MLECGQAIIKRIGKTDGCSLKNAFDYIINVREQCKHSAIVGNLNSKHTNKIMVLVLCTPAPQYQSYPASIG